ncbi:MAG: phage integrase SAM-like domain-containing protein, partial [Gemmatimonadota bacterium]
MPTKRGRRYKTDRYYPGVGRIHRSLRTDNAEVARKREQMLTALCNRGMTHFVRAFKDGRLDIVMLEEYHETGRHPELAQELNRSPDVTLAEAERAFLPTLTDITKGSRRTYGVALNHLKRYAGSTDVTVRELFSADFVARFVGYLEDDLQLQTATASRVCSCISRLSRYCADRGWIDERLHFKLKRSPGRMRWLEPGEIALYLAHMRPAMRPLHILLMGTGIDLGEAIPTRDYPDRGLRVCDLRISSQGAWAIIEAGKTEYRNRRVYLWPWVVTALQEHIERHGLSGSQQLFTWRVRR